MIFKKRFYFICSLLPFLFLACAETSEKTSSAQNNSVSEAVPDLRDQKIWRIAVISDMNKSYGSTTYDQPVTNAIKFITEQRMDLVLSTGDMVAGQKSDLNYQAMWNAFHSVVTKPLGNAKIPLLPSAGNHDASSGSGFQKERELYVQNWKGYPIDRFNNENRAVTLHPGVKQNYPLNYVAVAGRILLISLDATAVGPLINNQLIWLEDVLQKTQDFKVKIIFGHVPLYPFAFGRAHESLAQGGRDFHQRMESLLEKYNVNLFLSGHHHVYYPGHRNGHVQYVSVPLLGSGARVLMTRDQTVVKASPQGFLVIEIPENEPAFEALSAKDYSVIRTESLPEAISVPTVNSSDCVGCASMPSNFFINAISRILYYRR